MQNGTISPPNKKSQNPKSKPTNPTLAFLTLMNPDHLIGSATSSCIVNPDVSKFIEGSRSAPRRQQQRRQVRPSQQLGCFSSLWLSFSLSFWIFLAIAGLEFWVFYWVCWGFCCLGLLRFLFNFFFFFCLDFCCWMHRMFRVFVQFFGWWICC